MKGRESRETTNRNQTQMSENPITETELTEEHYDFLWLAGCSQPFMDVLQRPVGGLPETVDRNSVRAEIQKYVRFDMLGDDPYEFQHMGGGFFAALWDGNLYDAFTRADVNNKKILLTLFTEERINRDRRRPGYPTVARLQGQV